MAVQRTVARTGDAPQPQISQSWRKVPTGRKHVTSIRLGPHTVDVVSYPNKGYYIEIAGESMTISKLDEILHSNGSEKGKQ